MKSDIIIVIMLISPAAALVIIELFVGIRGHTGRKPFLESSRRLLFPNLLMGTVLLTFLVDLLFEVESIAGAVLWTIFALLGLIAIGRRIVKPFIKPEYTAYGFDDESLLQKTLLASLTSLEIPYEKTPSGVRLPSLEIDLVVDDKRKDFRCGGFHTKQWRFDRSTRRVLDDLVRNMNEYLRDSPNITFDSVTCRKHLAWSVVMIIIAGAMVLYVVLR